MAKRVASLSIENIGDSQYLTDHHNRCGECLLYCAFSRGDSIAAIESEIRESLSFARSIEKGIPNRVTVSAQEIADCVRAISGELLVFEGDVLDVQVLVTWR